jgi:hypothetical protein
MKKLLKMGDLVNDAGKPSSLYKGLKKNEQELYIKEYF